jgi:hypothetical protein
VADTTLRTWSPSVIIVLKENAAFDDKALVAFIDKFKTPLLPRSITMLGSPVKNVEKLKKHKDNKIGGKKKASEISRLRYGYTLCNLHVVLS